MENFTMGKYTFQELGFGYRITKSLVILTENEKDTIAFYSITSAVIWLKAEAWRILYKEKHHPKWVCELK